MAHVDTERADALSSAEATVKTTFFASRRRHTRCLSDWSSDVCSSDLLLPNPWYRERVILIGDAAHATTPHLASGAGMAVEDGIVLAEEVTRDADIDAALPRFMKRRFERGKLAVENSL